MIAIPASGQVQPVSVDSLAVAVSACILAVDGEQPIAETLVASGWSEATLESDEPVQTPLLVFGHSDSEAVIMTLNAGEGEPEPCVVVARLPSTTVYHPSAEGLSRIIGMPVSREDNQYTWRFAGKLAQMAPTGSADAPSLRFLVIRTGDN
ncbi:hypothetical protein [Erythrobacter alti]|uniref:hypothetical protein n=1 Tax=Erythrobacter alti TaxID=1896145 RepID=UPI0030F38F68